MIAVVGPPITREAARAAAQHELSKPIYHRYEDPWPIRVLRWVGRWIDRLTSDVTRHSPGGAAGAVAILVAVIAIAVVARWRFGPMQRTRRQSTQLMLTPERSAADYRREAESAAARKEWNVAVVARMRAVARELEERGTVEPLPGRTADELAGEVARQLPGIAEVVRRAVTVFDDVAYGDRPADRPSYDAVRAADDALRERRPVPVP